MMKYLLVIRLIWYQICFVDNDTNEKLNSKHGNYENKWPWLP